MPEPLTNLDECFTCKAVGGGEKKLLLCLCHAAAYCCKECQVADRPRHKRNCIPVMPKEIEVKGQGLVAARDFEIGDLIFTDKPAFIVKEKGFKDMFLSVVIQIDNLSEEEDSSFYAMTEPWRPIRDRDSELDKAWLDFSEGYRSIEMTILIQNGEVVKKWSHVSLYLNAALINHSCSPNAAVAGLERLAMVEEKSRKVNV